MESVWFSQRRAKMAIVMKLFDGTEIEAERDGITSIKG